MVAWHFIVHFFGIDYGASYGRWVWYNFWSGVAGSFLIGAIVWLSVHYVNSTCHASTWCLRRGKYQAAGGTFKLCHKHHPDMDGQKPNSEMINRIHEEYKASCAVQS